MAGAPGDRRAPELPARSPCWPSGRPGPDVGLRRGGRRGERGGRRWPSGAPPGTRPASTTARWRCCSGSTPSPRRIEQALAEREHPLPGARRRAVLRAARGPPGPDHAADRGPKPPTRERPARSDGATRCEASCFGALGWTPEPPDRRRRGPRALGVAGRPGQRGRGPGRGGARPADARPGRRRRPSWTGGPRPSTSRPPRGSPSRPCTRPRGWSGTRSRWSGCTRARCRSCWPTAPERGRGGAPAALRRGDPGPRAPADLLVADPQRRRQLTRKPSRFLDPASGPGTGAARGRRAGSDRGSRRRQRGAGGALPAVRPAAHRRRPSASWAGTPAARRPTTSRRSRRCATGGRQRGQGAGPAGVLRLHRRHPDRDRRGPAEHARRS